MPDAHRSLETKRETDSAVEPSHAPQPELTPEEAGADLDSELDLNLAGFKLPATTQVRESELLPQGIRAWAIASMQRNQGNFAVQRMLKRSKAPPATGDPPKSEPDGDGDWLAERIEDASGGGQAIETGARARLEAGLQSGLGDVRVHTDGEAANLAGEVHAVAFTSGQDIFFGPGAYQPGTSQGLELLAHEAAHTVQQAAGPVAGTPAAGGVLLSDPADPYEQAAEKLSQAVTTGAPIHGPQEKLETNAMDGNSVQRAELPPEDEESKKLPPEAMKPVPGMPKKPEELA